MSFVKLLPAALVLLAACGKKTEAPREAEPAPVPVTTVAVETRRLPSERVLAGTVTARTTGAASARLPGHIREIRVREGDMVQAGQVIAILDGRDADAAIRQAEAAREEARAALPEADAAILSATAQVDLAKATFGRMRELKASNSITQQEFDEAQARFRLAESAVKMAEARKLQTRQKIRQTEEAVSRAQLQQTYSTITAPFAGVVLERKAEPGTFASPGMPVVILERAGDYRLEVPVEESLLKELKPGVRVTVELETTAELPISEILPALNAQSRTATVRINLPSKDLRSGMSGRIRIAGQERNAITVPASAVRANGQLQSVFIAANNRARAVLVSLGDARDGSIEVLSGLDGSERLIAVPPAGLADGARIEVAK